MIIWVIIVTYNNAQTLADCLHSLLQQSLPLKILIVDNASTDTTLQIAKSFNKLICIENKQNRGYAKSNNQGIRYALEHKVDYVLILNPDTIIYQNAIQELVKDAQQQSNKGIFGPVIYSNNNKIWSQGGILDKKRYSAKLVGFNKKKSEYIYELDFLSGTCLLIPQKVLATGLRFYEPYFMYYEDVEFCISAAKQGYKSFIVNSARITHTEVSRQKVYAKQKEYYLARNHLLFVERNAPFTVKLHEFLRLPKTLTQHYRDNNTGALLGIKDYFLRRFYKYEYTNQ